MINQKQITVESHWNPKHAAKGIKQVSLTQGDLTADHIGSIEPRNGKFVALIGWTEKEFDNANDCLNYIIDIDGPYSGK